MSLLALLRATPDAGAGADDASSSADEPMDVEGIGAEEAVADAPAEACVLATWTWDAASGGGGLTRRDEYRRFCAGASDEPVNRRAVISTAKSLQRRHVAAPAERKAE